MEKHETLTPNTELHTVNLFYCYDKRHQLSPKCFTEKKIAAIN